VLDNQVELDDEDNSLQFRGLFLANSNWLPGITTELDKLAKELIFQANKVHTTAVPGNGPYKLLVAENPIGDLDGDGKFSDELLNNGSLPFDVKSGELYVTVTETSTGEIVKHKLDLNANKSTLGDLSDALNDIPHINAEISSLGNLRITSDAGYGYDFSPTLDANPDNAGTFGSGKASLGTQAAEPFALADGQTLDFSVTLAGVPTPVAINLQLDDFEDITEATAAELAAVINADPAAQSAGLEAAEVGGHLILQTSGAGATEAFDVVGGTALAGLGWSSFAGSTISGSDNSVAPGISGVYDGDGNGVYSFVPTGDGIIGTTPGLGVGVYDEKGDLVVTLDVGEGYVPGTDIVVANGISVSFGLGDLSASEGDRFELDVVSDPDTTDVLVALGLGGLFTGSSAVDIGVREDIELDPSLLATGFGNGESDGSALLELFNQKDVTHTSLGGGTFDEFYSQFVGAVGFEASTAETALMANDALLGSLQQQREQISGVNLDEEMTNMLRYEQAYQAAAQYIQAVNSLNEAVLSLI
jgi:flagellar hook-associated protein FlgK